MGKGKTKRRTPVVQKSVEPPVCLPQATLYQRHAIALIKLLRFVDDHTRGYELFLPDGYADDVLWKRVHESFRAFEDVLTDAVQQAFWWPDLTDENYRFELGRAHLHAEYEPIETLTAMVGLMAESDRLRVERRAANVAFIDMLRKEADKLDPPTGKAVAA